VSLSTLAVSTGFCTSPSLLGAGCGILLEVVKEGEEIEVKVLRVDREKGKISLGRKQVLPDPWEGIEDRYPVGAVVEGEVTRTAPFGAFVQLEPGVEGLVHISEVSATHVGKLKTQLIQEIKCE